MTLDIFANSCFVVGTLFFLCGAITNLLRSMGVL